jgi:hypothetical protein
MNYVNDRNVKKLGPACCRISKATGVDSPTLSAARSSSVPSRPVFLHHGSEGSSLIRPPIRELLADYLRSRGVEVILLFSELITHAEVDALPLPPIRGGLISFWATC